MTTTVKYYIQTDNDNVVTSIMFNAKPTNLKDWIAVQTDEVLSVGMVYLGSNNFSDTDLKWEETRAKRNMLLAATDWTQLADVAGNRLTQSKVDAYKVYRQALADIPQNFSNPDEVVWPIKPE